MSDEPPKRELIRLHPDLHDWQIINRIIDEHVDAMLTEIRDYFPGLKRGPSVQTVARRYESRRGR